MLLEARRDEARGAGELQVLRSDDGEPEDERASGEQRAADDLAEAANRG